MSEWINVQDKLPEIGQQVIAFRPDAEKSGDQKIRFAIFNGKGKHGFDCYCTPSHWMPSPKDPA